MFKKDGNIEVLGRNVLGYTWMDIRKKYLNI